MLDTGRLPKQHKHLILSAEFALSVAKFNAVNYPDL